MPTQKRRISMIKRDRYLNMLINSKNNGFPKVITGIRRCGKSFLLKTLYKDYLLNSGVSEDRILILELDDSSNIEYRNPLKLHEYVMNFSKGKDTCYIMLDEIQKVFSIVNPSLTNGEIKLAKKGDHEIVSFVDVILGLSRQENIDLYVTGSNSKMLSSDIITEFRDKATEIHLSPLSFEEYFSYVGGSATEAIAEYMRYGGMPLAVLKKKEDKQAYLKGLFQTTYFSDILEHNSLHKNESLDELCNILSSTIGQLINSEKIATTYSLRNKEKISKDTVNSYISYFENAFLIKEVKRFDVKGQNEIGALRKYYFCDVGLRNARLDFVFPDEGQLLENVVFNELLYNGYGVNVGTFDSFGKNKNDVTIRKTNEIDFYAVRGNRRYYIQVCNDISNVETKRREISPYVALDDQIQKILVVNKPLDECFDEHGYTIIGITDFLLRFIK